ncbi:single-stranded DNA-binding protein [Bifidobacterium gallicum]|uniref:Single-stranded DNA-binding protein n=1 Tax=Bifidobacterium gallicum DSM 20093 = LMG 11596 TaxID=561180 RepID=D1NWJ3_9BIFI|nr:single-stranded DNA-binding protein [Bifidobacterium gallicum]EFA22479.1 single-strand binding family protein [Bifidobacterium gallicum DSM 20093 = LMG 11596]KFI58991.1 single-stranded DNA-binding protein [Bifidobacterium gallicum DSM 20093 = LMG 11596]
MAGETVITIVGNLTGDPELRTLNSGAVVASFTIASTPRTYNRNSGQFEDGNALFMRCSAWRDLGEHCAKSLSKGTRVIAQGRLQQRSYQAQDGSQRTVVELQVDEIGPSLRYATAQVQRQSSSGGFNANNGGGFNQNNGGNGGYQGGANYQGGAGYQGGGSNFGAQPQQLATDPWSSPAPADDPYTSFGASEFGGASQEPEF